MSLQLLTFCVMLICYTEMSNGERSSNSRKTGVIPTARCRSRCLAKFLKPNIGGDDCQHSPDCQCQQSLDCLSCWNVCETIFSNYDIWRETCKKRKFCRTGCQVACQFRRILPKINVAERWQFSETPAVYPGTTVSKAFMAWNQPVLKNTLPGVETGTNQHLVYILLTRDTKKRHEGNAWQQILQTSSTMEVLDLSPLSHPEFWLLAVGEYGTLAEVRFNASIAELTPYTGDIIKIPDRKPLNKGNGGFVEYVTESTLNLTLDRKIGEDGRLYPTLSWANPDVLPARGQSALEYTIDYYLNNCECDLPRDHFADTVETDPLKRPKYTFSDIAFSAEYLVEVSLYDDPNWKGELTFFTPECERTKESDPTRCLTKINMESRTRIKTTTLSQPTTTPSSTTAAGTSDMGPDNIVVDKHNTLRPADNILDWNITKVDMRYDPKSQHVFVHLKWPIPFNRSKVSQQLVWTNLVHKNHLDAGRKEHIPQSADATSDVLELKPNNLYQIYVVASYTDDYNKEIEIRSRETLVNTNVTDHMPHVLARKASIDQEKDILNGIIVGVTVVASIIMFGIIILFIYKKRQSFRDIIITKTAVAKSNSYKSNVGCKVDYSNQVLITSDDWEIDCRQLKFASHIGQGAFGKVVTGYYQDQRVAIKLVRDCAPISYKEDLLAEINLMKRLDSHPNIVSMVGAVTLMEPICLVMEYAPYGNLQNFLKKCRLEGEVTVQAGRSPELNYSLMDEHGGLNEGVVTPADLLSFARQVSMAMEYLGAKKYVHRDLAARNVLLGYDKIIKVCDFGLSRDIYNDNQYKKLTNGKLPLKWMAIESLRDRVFTTQSDVWSFGILLWEIVTMGASPYPNIALADLYYLLSNHYRMEKPSNCSEELYIIMRQCWLDNPTDRPNFTDLRVQLELLLTRDRNYLDLENINVPLSTPESSGGSPVSDETASLLAAQALQPQRKSSKDELTVDVCIHEKSVEKLLKRKGDFDLHNITIL